MAGPGCANLRATARPAARSCAGRPDHDDATAPEEEQMRSSQTRRAGGLLAALALIGGVLLVGAAPVSAADPLVLNVGTDQKLKVLNPWFSITYADYEVFQLQYDLLVGFGTNLEPVPGFADTWESSADGLTHTFHIREGMLWSDGEPATCEDARWTYDFVLKVVASDRGFVGSGYLEPYLTNTGLKSVGAQMTTSWSRRPSSRRRC
jgi:ABC-type transport system substrate-binding protein